MPAGPGHAHSEDLPWLEVPQPLPAAETESDRGGSMVPPICGEAALREMHSKSHTERQNKQIDRWH